MSFVARGYDDADERSVGRNCIAFIIERTRVAQPKPGEEWWNDPRQRK
ncbi:MAG TPA: hypothetical protein VGD02_07315 [Gemmatimonadaceae bacterium]